MTFYGIVFVAILPELKQKKLAKMQPEKKSYIILCGSREKEKQPEKFFPAV